MGLSWICRYETQGVLIIPHDNSVRKMFGTELQVKINDDTLTSSPLPIPAPQKANNKKQITTAKERFFFFFFSWTLTDSGTKILPTFLTERCVCWEGRTKTSSGDCDVKVYYSRGNATTRSLVFYFLNLHIMDVSVIIKWRFVDSIIFNYRCVY